MLDYIMHLSPGILIALAIVLFIALISQSSLYAKAGKPWIAALVPIWNFVVFVEVVGRPKWHSIWMLVPLFLIAGVVGVYWPEINGLFPVVDADLNLIPGSTQLSDLTVPFIIMGVASLPLIIFTMVVFTEICDSFGKHSTSDKVLCIIFNGVYILFVIGISDAEYEGPWYAKKHGLPYEMPVDPKKLKAQQMAQARALANASGHANPSRQGSARQRAKR